jgi:hypothetical protein
LFNKYQRYFHLALKKFSGDPDKVNHIYSYFSVLFNVDDRWFEKIMDVTYLGQRTSDASERTKVERNSGR